ncbi:Uncharacterized protein SCF082_LOCUS9358 [Durusdinium trenchii]|uniref:Tetratricopeptide repeat protein n=1 Tax=Durusdinium trenchii TaxID=1381693 RepID=A0ABP0IYL9_9DINO
MSGNGTLQQEGEPRVDKTVLCEEHGPVWKITTKSAECQRLFSAAMQMIFAFNHEVALETLELARQADEDACMPLWAIAFCNGVNYNLFDCEEAPGAFPSNADAVRFASLALDAATRNPKTSKLELDLVRAIQVRNASPGPEARPTKEAKEAMRAKLNEAFAAEMAQVEARHPFSADVTCLTIEAAMNLKPWALFTEFAGEPVGADGAFPGTQPMLDKLRDALTKAPNHLGLLHMLIHCGEMGPLELQLEILPDANHLVELTRHTDLTHLTHMPSHISIWTGHYEEAATVNEQAIARDRNLVEIFGYENFFTLYRLHNYHMLVFAALLAGQRERAVSNGRALRDHVFSIGAFLEASGMDDFFEGFSAVFLHALIRFGDWDEILAEPAHANETLFQSYNTTRLYARTLALVIGKRDLAAGKLELEKFEQALDAMSSSRMGLNNPVKDILQVGRLQASAEVLYFEEQHGEAFDLLEEAIKVETALIYDEPSGWMMPVRHALGALLAEQGRIKEARAVFLRDLEVHPRNIWSLEGLQICASEDDSHPLSDEHRQQLAEARKVSGGNSEWADPELNYDAATARLAREAGSAWIST